MKVPVIISVVLLTALTSCFPDAFSKQKYTNFKNGSALKLFGRNAPLKPERKELSVRGIDKISRKIPSFSVK